MQGRFFYGYGNFGPVCRGKFTFANRPKTMLSHSEFLLQQLPLPQTKAQLQFLQNWVGNNPGRLNALIRVFVNGNYRLAQRAVRIISQVSDATPELLAPHLPALVHALAHTNSNAVKRNLVRLLQVVNLPEEQQGEIAQQCFAFVNNPKEAIAVRAFAITVLARICQLQPELTREFALLLDRASINASAAIVHRIGEARRKLGLTTPKPRR